MINHFVALTDHCVGRCGLYSKKQGVWVEPVQEKEQREELPLNDNSFRVNCNRQRNRGMKKQNKPSKMHTHTHTSNSCSSKCKMTSRVKIPRYFCKSVCAGTTQSLNFIIGKITDLQKSQGKKRKNE